MSEPSRNFQHYELLRRADGSPWELGRGSMGITYKAFDVNLCCEVALKVVNSTILDHPNARERFVREARAAAALRHRNVASVYHLGSDGEHFFYAMEFVDGETLDALVRRRGPMPVAAALGVLLQVAKALVAAERQHLVHRDIKPANLMAVHEDGDDEMTVKVIDFGLARPSAEFEGAAQLTVGGFVGTPQYASPEQLEEQPLDARSDLYSLGVTGWYLLTASPPFGGSLAAVCQKQVSEAPPWEKLPPGVPKSVQALLGHLLEKAPADRPQSARDLRAEIERVLETLPEDARSKRWESSTAADPMPLTRLVAGRYLPKHILEETPGSKVCLATDEHDGGTVVIRTLPAQLAAGDGENLEDEIRLIQAAPHPGLVEIYALENEADETPGYLVEEALSGFSLRDLVAARNGTVGLEDALRIMEMAAAAVDHATNCRLPRLDLTLHHVHVHFPYGGPGGDAEASLESWRTLPSSAWPSWGVKIHPFSTRHGTTESKTWAGDLTLVPGVKDVSERPGSFAAKGLALYLKAFAGLIFELLGGLPGSKAMDDSLRGRTATLPRLNEAGNGVLREALSGASAFTDCREFHHALSAAATVVETARPAPSAGARPSSPTFPRTGDSKTSRIQAPLKSDSTIAEAGVHPTAPLLQNNYRSAFEKNDLLGEQSSAWERLQPGQRDAARPGRWLLAVAAMAVVFMGALGAVLAFLLHGGPSRHASPPAGQPVVADAPTPMSMPPMPRVEAAVPARTVVPRSTPVEEISPSPAVVVRPVPAEASQSGAAKPMVAIHLFSRLRGAEVRWQGQMLGTTPVDVHLPPGRQEFIVRYPDGPETHQSIYVREDQPELAVEIQPMRSDLLPFNLPPAQGKPRPGNGRVPIQTPTRPSGVRVEPAVPVAPPPRREAVPVRRPSALEPFTQTPVEERRADPEKATPSDSGDDD